MSNPTKCCKIIYAVCILHNICINKNIPMPEDDGNSEDGDAELRHIYREHHDDEQTTRNNLIANRFMREYFTRMSLDRNYDGSFGHFLLGTGRKTNFALNSYTCTIKLKS